MNSCSCKCSSTSTQNRTASGRRISQLVVTGAILEVVTVLQPGGAAELPEVFVSQVRVLDATGVEDPVSIGRGTIASWSPH